MQDPAFGPVEPHPTALDRSFYRPSLHSTLPNPHSCCSQHSPAPSAPSCPLSTLCPQAVVAHQTSVAAWLQGQRVARRSLLQWRSPGEESQAAPAAPEHLQFICPCQPESLMTLMSCLSFTQRKSPFKDHQPISVDRNCAGHGNNMCWVVPKC